MFVTDVERKMVQEFKANNAVNIVREIVALAGNRFVGTEGDKKAADYVRKYFSGLGLTVKETPIEVPSFEDEGAKVIMGDGTELKAIPAYFSLPAADPGIEAEAVFIGGGQDADYEGKDVSGKIVVLRELSAGYDMFWLGTFAKRAYDRGALALIVVHPMAWPYRMSMEAGNCYVKDRFLKDRLPALCISALDGLTLMQAIGAGKGKVRFISNVKLGMTKSCYISGYHYGTEIPEERVGIIGHRDNGYPDGANDNLSGTSTMLELARVMSAHKFKRTIEFISSTAEEGCTNGMHEFVEHNKDDLAKHMVGFFNIDMIGGGGKLKLVDEGWWPDRGLQKHDENMMVMIEKTAVDLGYEVGRMTASWGVSESGRMIDIGVPSVWFWKPDDQYYHSALETVENLDGNAIKVVGDLTGVTAAKILNK